MGVNYLKEINMADEQTAVVTAPTPIETKPIPAEVSQSQMSTQTEPVQATPVEPAGDILTRVSKKKEFPKELTPEESAQTFKEFESITDPTLKAEAIRKYKDVQSYATKTNQEKIALEKKFQEFQDQSKNWTPERIQRELLNNPQFLQAAQSVASVQNPVNSGLTDEQFSALTPGEKNQMMQMNQQIGELKQQNFLAALNQKDALLQAKYGDYDALKINQGIQDLARMNPLDIREQAYKALLHDEHVKAAYELGKQEASTLNQTRAQASTQPGVQLSPSDKRPIRDKRDTDMSYFVKIAEARLAESKGMSATKR